MAEAKGDAFAVWLASRTVADGTCLVWNVEVAAPGPPLAKWDGRTAVVRRLVWERHHGPVGDELYVTPTSECPRPILCVAWEHSRVLTPQQACTERALAGRFAHGEVHWNSRLSEEQAFSILVSLLPTRELATQYQVSPTTVSAIRGGRRWKHLRRSPTLD